jgi:hypothetical protein
MSIDVSRAHIIPIEALPAAFEALAEIAMRRRKPCELPVILPGGATAVLRYGPEAPPLRPEGSKAPFDLTGDGRRLAVDFPFRVAVDQEIEDYLRNDPEPPFAIVRSRSGARRAIFIVSLSVSIEHPFAMVSFADITSRDVTTFQLKAACDVMDYVGRCADRIVTYMSEMGEDRFVEPITRLFPELSYTEDGPGEMARIVEHVRRVVEGTEQVGPA